MWNALILGFGFALGVWVFVALLRWARGPHQRITSIPRRVAGLSARDWLWLSPVALVLGYILLGACGVIH